MMTCCVTAHIEGKGHIYWTQTIDLRKIIHSSLMLEIHF